MSSALLVFAASGLLLVLTGTVLTRSADTIAERLGLGRLWIGSVLLASATSLPELATDVSAVRLGTPDLGAGDLFGSSMANMLILAIIGLMPPVGRVFRDATPQHAMGACLAMSLNAAAGVFVVVRPVYPGWLIGPEPVLLAVAYLVGMRVVYRYGARGAAPAAAPTATSAPAVPGLRRALVRFGLAALGVLLFAPAFAWSAKQIAELSGLGATFVGTWLVGFSTSLPEVVTSVAAVRMGAVDLAIGNLFGSNALNMAIFLPMDLAAPGGALFGGLDPSHVISALIAIILMAVGLAAIVLRSEGRWAVLEPGSLLMVIIYVTGMWTLYTYTSAAPRP